MAKNFCALRAMLVAGVALHLLPGLALAQIYPSKPIPWRASSARS
jgi:hypothetical protein